MLGHRRYKAIKMPISCQFALNGKTVSVLRCDAIGTFPAFSGQNEGRDNPAAVSKADIGPLPQGRYYIVDRQSGGRLGRIRDFLLEHFYGTDRDQWFALYRNDGTIDDVTFVEGVKRGNFRLHPIGPRGLSEGCITLTNGQDFTLLHDRLKATTQIAIPGSTLRAYGTVDVR